MLIDAWTMVYLGRCVDVQKCGYAWKRLTKCCMLQPQLSTHCKIRIFPEKNDEHYQFKALIIPNSWEVTATVKHGYSEHAYNELTLTAKWLHYML